MWELDIIISYKYRKYLFYIKESIIHSAHYNKKGIFAIIGKGSEAIMSMAIIDPSTELLDEISRVIAECMIFCEKELYLAGLKIVCSKEYKSALIKTLVLIDISEDIDYAAARLDIAEKVINIHSFFQFKLHNLKDKWEKMYKTLLPDGKVDDDSVVTMLKDIIDNNNQSISIKIEYVDKSYILSSSHHPTIHAQTEADVIANLILLSPSEIHIDQSKISTDSLILLSYLFQNKIVMSNNKK